MSVTIITLPVLLSIAWFTLLERILLSLIHFRTGPEEWFFGIVQPLLDGMSLFIKSKLIEYRSGSLTTTFTSVISISISINLFGSLGYDY